MANLREKLLFVKKTLQGCGRVLLAYSGGVDSNLLACLAHEVLGENALAVTVCSPVFSERERGDAARFASQIGISHLMVDFDVFVVEGFAQNPPDRCYHCKKALLQKLQTIAVEREIPYVIEASNVDDESDYRPGLRAIEELGILSPLRKAGLTKREIRELSASFGLPSADKPSLACLATRFPYGETLTPESLRRVERAEAFLLRLGFGQFRVRCHGDVARIEVPLCDTDKLLLDRKMIASQLKKYGFSYISLDLEGFRSGSMNKGMRSITKGM